MLRHFPRQLKKSRVWVIFVVDKDCTCMMPYLFYCSCTHRVFDSFSFSLWFLLVLVFYVKWYFITSWSLCVWSMPCFLCIQTGMNASYRCFKKCHCHFLGIVIVGRKLVCISIGKFNIVNMDKICQYASHCYLLTKKCYGKNIKQHSIHTWHYEVLCTYLGDLVPGDGPIQSRTLG